MSRLEANGETELGDTQVQYPASERARLDDVPRLDDVTGELLAEGYFPSFCTSCCRMRRTGEHFMEFAVPGFIRRFCTPNAITTLMEYLVNYASPETRAAGEKMIRAEVEKIESDSLKAELLSRPERIRQSDDRDLHF